VSEHPVVAPEDRRSVSCCASTDIDTVRHPGEVMRVHWLVMDGLGQDVEGPVVVDAPTTLKARLSGPYADVRQLKSRVIGAVAPEAAYEAPQITLEPGAAGVDRPVSEIRLPANAAPGFYELDTAVSTQGATFSGGSVVQVAAGK